MKTGLVNKRPSFRFLVPLWLAALQFLSVPQDGIAGDTLDTKPLAARMRQPVALAMDELWPRRRLIV